jgi:hypothetical protein
MVRETRTEGEIEMEKAECTCHPSGTNASKVKNLFGHMDNDVEEVE